MSLTTQALSLMQRAAILRQDLFGINQTGDPQMAAMEDSPGATFRCYFAPGTFGERLNDMGAFVETHKTILRVQKTESNFNCQVGKIVILFNADPVTGADRRVKIKNYVALSFSGPSPEFVVECDSEF